VNRLVPTDVAARAEPAGRLPLAFGRRFFLLLFAGLIWIMPAWREPRLIYVMLAWDALALLLWAWDAGQMAKPGQLEVRRAWSESLGLTKRMPVTIEVRNHSASAISASVTDESPETFTPDLAKISIEVPARSARSAAYPIEPRARGDARFGNVWLRYQSRFGLAERWARAALPHTDRV